MADESKARVASEVYELVRLLSRLFGTLYGLLLIQMGWVYVATWLIGSRSENKGYLWLPLSGSWRSPGLEWTRYTEFEALALGAVVVAIVWALLSGAVVYLLRPFVTLFFAFLRTRPGLLLSFLVYGGPLGLLNLAAQPVTHLILRKRTEQARMKIKRDWQEKKRKADPAQTDADLERSWKEFEDAIAKERGAGWLESHYREASGFNPDFIFDEAIKPLHRLFEAANSTLRVGYAPLLRFSLVEDVQAGKAAAQLFAQAEERLRRRLSKSKAARYVSFVRLPACWPTRSGAGAKWQARLLGLNTLLWGSFLDSDGKVIWLNVCQHTSHEEPPSDKNDLDLEYYRSWFPYRVQARIPAFLLRSDSADDAYASLLTALLESVVVRREKRLERGWTLRSGWDTVANESTRLVAAMTETLAFELTGLDLYASKSHTSVRDVAIDLVGQWIGVQLAEFADRDGAVWGRRDERRIACRLAALSRYCAENAPSHPVHRYREGAMQVMAGNKDGAVRAFRYAARAESPLRPNHFIGALTSMQTTSLADDPALARWAAYAAAVIASGDSFGRAELEKDLASVRVQLHQDSIAVQTVNELIR